MNEQTLVKMITDTANSLLRLAKANTTDTGDFGLSAIIKDGRRDGLLIACSELHKLLSYYYGEKLKEIKR